MLLTHISFVQVNPKCMATCMQESKDKVFLRKPRGSPSWGRSRGLRDVNSLSSSSLNSFLLSKSLPCSRTNPKNSSTRHFFSWGSEQLERDGHMKHSSLTHLSMWPWQCQEHVWPSRTSSQPWNQTVTALPTHWKQTLRPVSTGGLHMLKQESSHQQPMPPPRAELPSTKYSAQCLVSSVTSCLSFRMSVTQHTMKFTLQMGS